MGLLNIFRKNNSNNEFKPSNRLEELLIQAANNPAARPEFYKQLFHYDLLVMGTAKTQDDGSSKLSLASGEIDGEPTNYVYTSKNALEFVAREQSRKIEFVGLKAISLFQMLAGQDKPCGFMLNANTPYGKHFTASEIKSILNDTKGVAEEVVIKEQTENFIGQPKIFPKDLVEQLKLYIKASRTLDDILFGQHVYDDNLAYLGVLCPKNVSSESEIKEVVNDIGVMTSEMKLSEPMDMILCNQKYWDLHKKGALISVRNY